MCFKLNDQLQYPASSVVSICRRIKMCSTVGDLVPIWRRNKLLNICATSLRPYVHIGEIYRMTQKNKFILHAAYPQLNAIKLIRKKHGVQPGTSFRGAREVYKDLRFQFFPCKS